MSTLHELQSEGATEIKATLFTSWEYWDADWTVEAIESGTEHSLGVNPELQAIFAHLGPNSQTELIENAKREHLSQRLENDYAIWQKKIVANLDRMRIKGVPTRNILDQMSLEADAGKLQTHFLHYIKKKCQEGGYDQYMAEATIVDWLMAHIFTRVDGLKQERQERATKVRRTEDDSKFFVPQIKAQITSAPER